jgi:hypothetical protein
MVSGNFSLPRWVGGNVPMAAVYSAGLPFLHLPATPNPRFQRGRDMEQLKVHHIF